MQINLNSAIPKAANNRSYQNTRNVNNSIAFHGRQDYMYEMNEELAKKKANKLLKYIGTGLGAILLSIGCINSCKVVAPGERGIKVQLGELQPEVYDEGIHAKWPFIETIKTLDVKTQNKEDSTRVYTKDLQQALVEYSVNYNLIPNEIDKLYKEIGTDYEKKIIGPRVYGAIKDVIGKTEAQTLIANRTEAANQVIEALQKKLKNKHINVTNFEFTNIDYKDEFENAIEDKVIAEQDALKAKNRTVQVEEEAKQKVIAAEAEAKSMAIRAEALSQNKNLVEYEAVQKWDGKLPQYMMGNSVPFINLNATHANK